MRRKRLKKRRGKLIIIAAVALVLIVICMFAVNNGLYPAMITLSEAKVKKVATEAMLDAILSCFSENTPYANLLTAHDNGNKIYMLQADTLAMNKLASECTSAAQDRLAKLGDIGIRIAIGTLSGIPIFSGDGPKVKITFTPASSVHSEFVSALEPSGINQTLYRVKIILTAQIYVILPGVSHSVTVQAETAIAESVIVGDVPQVYTNVESTEDMLNLIPTELP